MSFGEAPIPTEPCFSGTEVAQLRLESASQQFANYKAFA
jgi:hypothetical protein